MPLLIHRRPARRRGFTLIELLLTIVLLGVVVAFAWPDFSASAAAQQIRESAYRLRGLVARCRAEAMNQTLRYRVRIRPDGSLTVGRQADALQAPQLYIRPRAEWAQTEVLLEGVWVESVQVLPEGPPPIEIIDDELRFPALEFNQVRVEELEQPLDVHFTPEGQSSSLRLVLRDAQGRGQLVTIDGRLGRVAVEELPPVSPDEARRPEPLPPEERVEYEPNQR